MNPNQKPSFTLYNTWGGYYHNETLINGRNGLAFGSLNVFIKGRGTEIHSRLGTKSVVKHKCDLGDYKPRGYNGNVLKGKFDFRNGRNKEITMKHIGNNMLVSDNLSDWSQIMGSEDFVDFDWNYTTWWDDSIKSNIAVFTNGSFPNKVFSWTGAITTVTQTTSTSIIVDDSFGLQHPDKKIMICCTEYEYESITGNEIKLKNFNGSLDFMKGCQVVSAVQEEKLINHPVLSGEGFVPSLLTRQKNHIFYADKNQNLLFVSNSTGTNGFANLSSNFISTTFVLGATEGYYFNLDGSPVALLPVKDGVLVFCSNDVVHYIRKKLVNVTVAETTITGAVWEIANFTIGEQQAVKHQWLATISQSEITYFSEENKLSTINFAFESGGNEQANSVDGGNGIKNFAGNNKINILSNDIKNEFEYITRKNLWADSRVSYFDEFALLAVPKFGRTYFYDFENGFFQPPQTLSFAAYSVREGKLYGHKYETDDVQEIFIGRSDNGSPYVKSVATHSDYLGYFDSYKDESHFMMMGYATENTVFDIFILRDEKFEHNKIKVENSIHPLTGKKENHVFQNNGYEKLPNSLKTDILFMEESFNELLRIHAIKELTVSGKSYLARQIIIHTDSIDSQFILTAFGTNSKVSDTSLQTNLIN